jgi:predicted HicB family RNase H-like nuclease
MKEKRIGPKRLTLDIDENMHAEVKSRAARRNIPLRLWVYRALLEAINKEKQYEQKGKDNERYDGA